MIANIQAENVILSGVLQSPDVIDRVTDFVSPEDFADPLVSRMFRAVCESHAAGLACGAVTINNMFKDDDAYKLAGGQAYMANLTASAAPLLGVIGHAKEVAELARRRRMSEGLAEVMQMALDQSVSASDIIEKADFAIGCINASTRGKTSYTAAECFDAMMAQLERKDRGVRCKLIPPMDDLLGGARRKQIIVLAARPGMGKTAVALSYSIGAAMNGHGVLYVSLEMSAAELGMRQAADICFDGRGGVRYSDIVNQELSEADYQRLRQAREIAADLPLVIEDESALSAARLKMLVRRYVRRFEAKGERLDLIVVDYMQLLSAGKGKNTYETISEVSMTLKEIAKEFDLAVIALAQLNREVEKRPGKRPQLSDLKESGQIEQDADAVMFLLRNEYYLRKEEPALTDPKRLQWEQAIQEHAGKIEFICAKRRNGPEGTALGSFHGAYQAVRGL